jgi:hypothetical protein
MEPYTTFWNGLYGDSPSSSKPRRGMNETLRGSPGKCNRSSKSIKAPTSLKQMTTDGKAFGVLWSSAQQRLFDAPPLGVHAATAAHAKWMCTPYA